MPANILSTLASTNLYDWLIYGAIALVTLTGLFKCIYPVLRNSALLNRGVAKLERSTAAGERPVWREARFLGRSLRADWQRFLLNAGQLDMRGMPCDTQEYINEDTVVDKPGHARLAELIPSLLTSLGILGTFIGLMEGLTSVDFSDAEGTIQSIPLLLSGMRFAFATSVAGISCSLLFNMFYRISVGRAYRALDNFEEAFYELAMPRPLAPDVQMMCQKLDEDERMARLAEGVGARMSSSLEMAVGRAMAPLTRSLDTFIQGATQEQMEGVKHIVSQFVKQLNISLSGQLDSLGDVMRKVGQDQLQTQQELMSTLEAAKAMAEDAQEMRQSCNEIAEQMRAWCEEARQTREERFQTAGDMEQRSDELAREIDALSFSLSQMRLAVDRFAGDLDDAQTVQDHEAQAPIDG